jgi:hypothetical protein
MDTSTAVDRLCITRVEADRQRAVVETVLDIILNTNARIKFLPLFNVSLLGFYFIRAFLDNNFSFFFTFFQCVIFVPVPFKLGY